MPGRSATRCAHEDFERVVAGLQARLRTLLYCPPYGRGPGRAPPQRSHGVYLFTEVSGSTPAHLYVGRVGITERARAAGSGHSNFRTRLAAHTRPSSSHNQATFAFRLAVEALGKRIEDLPTTRQARAAHAEFADVYAQQKQRLTAMEFRVVEIGDDFESYTFEPYAAYRLGTQYNSWATS